MSSWNIVLWNDPVNLMDYVVWVLRSVLGRSDEEARRMMMLAHEAGHIVGRHVERAMVNAYGLQALLSMALGTNPSQVKEIAAGRRVFAEARMLTGESNLVTAAQKIRKMGPQTVIVKKGEKLVQPWFHCDTVAVNRLLVDIICSLLTMG